MKGILQKKIIFFQSNQISEHWVALKKVNQIKDSKLVLFKTILSEICLGSNQLYYMKKFIDDINELISHLLTIFSSKLIMLRE